jgi:hypothetical protein
MADPKGVPPVVGVAPEAPGGSDDIVRDTPGGGPSKTWNVFPFFGDPNAKLVAQAQAAADQVSIDVATVNLVTKLLDEKLIKYKDNAAASAIVWELKNEISNW